MPGIALRQIHAVIAVCEEGSLTRAAERENATQSGISQHVAAVERALKVKLFERTSAGVIPTPAGLRYYRRCVEAVGLLDTAGEEARSLASFVTRERRSRGSAIRSTDRSIRGPSASSSSPTSAASADCTSPTLVRFAWPSRRSGESRCP